MVETVEDRRIRKLFGAGYSKLRDFNGSLFSIGGFEQFSISVTNELNILRKEIIED